MWRCKLFSFSNQKHKIFFLVNDETKYDFLKNVDVSSNLKFKTVIVGLFNFVDNRWRLR